MAIGDIKTFDIVYEGLTLQINAIDLGGGQTEFSVKCLLGSADINALYWGDDIVDSTNFDLGTKKDNSLNMNGTGVDWDGGYKVSSTGLGPLGTDKPSFLTAGETLAPFISNVSWDDVDKLGVRATSTSTAEGSIKGVDGGPIVTLAPKVCVDDAAPVIEGANASFTIHLDHVYAYDVTVNYTTVSGSATDGTDYAHTAGSVTILAGQLNAVVTVATTDDPTVENTEIFTLHLSGATTDIPGDDIPVVVLCADGTGTILDNDVETPPPGGNPPAGDPTALSHGYWMNHSFSDSEGFAGAVGATTFDDFFHLDDGAVVNVQDALRTWTDQTGAQNDPVNLDDLSFLQAVAFGNGAGNSGDTTAPVVAGAFEDLTREAATAVLNYYDADNSASFVEWYIYERNLNDNDANDGNNPTDAVSALADLKAQVQATVDGAAGAYTVGQLADLLHDTHHA
jgi:hypothetical protein